MATSPRSAVSVVSPRIYQLILSSPRLKAALLPEGPDTSPYEVLVYDATLTLDDPTGALATFERMEWVRFLQNGVVAVLDHFWGDGALRASYENSAGPVADSFKDGRRQHLVVVLPGAMKRGEMLPLTVKRQVEGGFTHSEEWLETTIDHPIRQLRRRIVFPKKRPCRKATLHIEDRQLDLRVMELPKGRTMVQFEAEHATGDTPFTIRWSW